MTDYDDKVIDDVDDVTNKLNEFDSLLFIGEKWWWRGIGQRTTGWEHQRKWRHRLVM